MRPFSTDIQRNRGFTKIVAHRGSLNTSNITQENTVDSILYALKIGADQVEFDLHQTKDNEWVIHHDFTLKDTKIKIKNSNLAEIREYYHAKGLQVDTLDELVDKLQASNFDSNQHLFNIELKPRSVKVGQQYSKKYEELDLFKIASTSSFSRRSLAVIRSNSELAKISYLRYIYNRQFIKRLHKKWQFYSFNPYYRFISPRTIKMYGNLGMEIHPWTVNKPEVMQHFFALKIGAIITDDVPTALKLRSSKKYVDES